MDRPQFSYLLKRMMDITVAAGVLLVFSPVLVVVAVLIRLRLGSPIFFRQRRPGLHGRPFMMVKFRTMTDARDAGGQLLPDAERLPPLGHFLRKTSLDETPQLVNVLLGQMSLVGPRPPIGAEVARYEPWQRRRLAVKPGLTCLWQVSGRSEISFEDWVRMDIWYVRNQGLGTDLKLLLRTPGSVIACRGAY